MKRTLTILSILTAYNAWPAHLFFDLADFSTANITNRQVTVTPVSVQSDTPTVYVLDQYKFTSDTSGQGWISNCFGAANYKVKVAGHPTISEFTILVPSTNGVVNASDIIVSGVTTAGGSYSASAADTRFVLRNSGTASNLTIHGPLFITNNATVDYVWTCTNATTGEGTWVISAGGVSTNGLASTNYVNSLQNIAITNNHTEAVNLLDDVGVGGVMRVTNASTIRSNLNVWWGANVSNRAYFRYDDIGVYGAASSTYITDEKLQSYTATEFNDFTPTYMSLDNGSTNSVFDVGYLTTPLAHITNLKVYGGITLTGDVGSAAQVLHTDGSGGVYWETPPGAGSGSVTTLKEGGAQVGDADIVTIDFLGQDFDLAESPNTEINVLIAAAITRDTEWDTMAEINAASTDTDAVLDTDIGATVQAYDAELTEWSGWGTNTAATAWSNTADNAISGAIGSTVQAYAANLSQWSGWGTNVLTDYAQPLEATLTDIADGTIAEDLVNTANPWADNEVADNITVDEAGISSAITRDTEWDTLAKINAATTDDDAPGLAAANTLTGSNTFTGSIIADLPNEFMNSLSGVSIPLGKTYVTNCTGDITFTGLDNTNPNVIRKAFVWLRSNGAERAITIPASWKNPNATTTFYVSNNWNVGLYIETYGSVMTNVTWSYTYDQ